MGFLDVRPFQLTQLRNTCIHVSWDLYFLIHKHVCLYILLYIILFIHVSPCCCLSFFLLSHLVPVCRYRGFNSSLTGSSLTSCRTVLTCNIWSLAEPIRFFSFLDQDSFPPHLAGLFYNILYSSPGSSHFFFQDLIFSVNCFGEFHA